MRVVAVVCRIIVTLAVAGPWALAAAADQGSVYQWVDSDGTPHYQDRPPEDAHAAQAAKELSLRYRLSDAEALAAAARDRAELGDAAQLRKQQQAEDRKADAGQRDQVKAEREQACAQAREKLQKYETAHRLYRPGADGERQYLSDEEIDAARVDARRAVAEWCSP